MLNLVDVSVKQCYEWIRTGHWNKSDFKNWLLSKEISYCEGKDCGHVVYFRSYTIVYEWVASKFWNFRSFKNWLNNFL